ncbi:MAG TPA: electron transfer flavoprotein subunit beta/FixA family protein [Thermomicrobiales bacterium]|nr:electron transfer flavoprotein subunit beta/FixA family protein [Thermomicrobiales bacterium]
MKIGVLIKQVEDIRSVRIDSKTGEPDITGTPVMDTTDALVVSESVDLREAAGGEITAIGLGPKHARDILVSALATGVDNALHILSEDTEKSDTLATARALADAVRDEGFDVLMAGKLSDDYGTGQVGLQVAELLGIRHLSSVVGIRFEDDALHVTRDVDGFEEETQVDAPVMLILAPSDEGPKRHPSLRGMMQAKRKPVREVETTVEMQTALSWTEPKAQARGGDRIMIEGADPAEAAAKLAAWLRENRLAG